MYDSKVWSECTQIDIDDNVRKQLVEYQWRQWHHPYKDAYIKETSWEAENPLSTELLLRIAPKWVAIEKFTVGFPSGGSAEYTRTASFNGSQLSVGEYLTPKWENAVFYLVS
jgi:hypothetical protein